MRENMRMESNVSMKDLDVCVIKRESWRNWIAGGFATVGVLFTLGAPAVRVGEG